MEYVKINSLWKREGHDFSEKDNQGSPCPKGKSPAALIVGHHSEEEFSAIKRWHVSEKVDGTNVRIMWNCYPGGYQGVNDLKFGGRTKDAQIPTTLMTYLIDHFTQVRLQSVFPGQNNVHLFGEGYGPKIQSGGNYRPDVGFILFDVHVDGWWLKREDVKMISERLEVPMVPDLGIMTEEQVIEFVKSKPLSRCSAQPQVMEGVVCRSEPLMLYRNKKPIMWKLKVKDFN